MIRLVRNYLAMRRARFTRDERKALRIAVDVPGHKLSRRQMELLMRFDAARGSLA